MKTVKAGENLKNDFPFCSTVMPPAQKPLILGKFTKSRGFKKSKKICVIIKIKDGAWTIHVIFLKWHALTVLMKNISKIIKNNKKFIDN